MSSSFLSSSSTAKRSVFQQNQRLNSMKRRRNQSTPIASSSSNVNPDAKSNNVEPLDESDQDQIVSDLSTELTQQHAQISTSFRYLCYTVIMTVMAATLYAELLEYQPEHHQPSGPARVAALLHGLALSPLLHWCSMSLIGTTATTTTIPWTTVVLPLIMVDVLCGVLPTLLERSSNNNDDNNTALANNLAIHHGVILLSNACTFGFALILRADQTATEQTLQDLKAAKYAHKTL